MSTDAKIMKEFKNINGLKQKCVQIDSKWRPNNPGRRKEYIAKIKADRAQSSTSVIAPQSDVTVPVASEQSDVTVPVPAVPPPLTDEEEQTLATDDLFSSLSGDLEEDAGVTFSKMDWITQDMIDNLTAQQITPTILKDQLQTTVGFQLIASQFKIPFGILFRTQTWLTQYLITDAPKRPVPANVQRDYISAVANSILSQTQDGDKTSVIRTRVSRKIQKAKFKDCRYNSNAHDVMEEVLMYLKQYGFADYTDDPPVAVSENDVAVAVSDNDVAVPLAAPVAVSDNDNDVAEPTMGGVHARNNDEEEVENAPNDDEDAKTSEINKSNNTNSDEKAKNTSGRGGNKRGLGQYVYVQRPSAHENRNNVRKFCKLYHIGLSNWALNFGEDELALCEGIGEYE
eukprot:190809_1